MVKKTTILLADDNANLRRGINELLKKAQDVTVIGEVDNGIDALKKATELSPDVLLLDIEMPGMNGIQVACRLKNEKSKVKILVLSAYDDREYIREILANGACGYIVKSEAPEILVDAVRGVARGEKGWYSREVIEKIKGFIDSSNGSKPLSYYSS